VGLGLFAFYQVNAKPAGLPTDRTVPYFLATMFPTGILGLVLAATLAASLSSIASAINSCTTVVMVDFYERLFKRRRTVPAEVARDTKGEGRKDVVLSRIITVVFGIIGVTLAANVSRIGNLIEIGMKIIQTFTGPLLGIYLLGMFTRRGTSLGALLGGILGTATGIYVAFFLKDEQGKDIIAFLWPAVFAFVIALAGGYLLSLLISALTGKKVSEEKKQLTWWHVMKRPLPDGRPRT
jgi:Na+/proline symporter